MERRYRAVGWRRRGGGALATSALPSVPVNRNVLGQSLFADRVPRAENERTHYGKSLDLTRIDWALRSAEHGRMMPITDISREQLTYDGHLSAVLNKRLNRLAALHWNIVPAAGAGIDKGKAEDYAAFVREQIEALPRFRDSLVDLAWGVYDCRAALELVWQYFNSRWNLVGLHWIHPRRLSFGQHRDLRVVDGRRGDGGDFHNAGFALEHPSLAYKFVTYKPRLWNDYPEREGLAIRTLYWSYFGRASVRERNILQELFGRPWRIMKPSSGPNAMLAQNDESVKSAWETVQRLGSHNTARLPFGWDLDIIQPFSGAGQVAGSIIEHSEKVQSKLVLGSTGTTDAVSTGLGSSIGDAHVSEEDLVIASDARREGETVEDQITDAIIAVNFGPSEVTHAPKFQFSTEPPTTREEEGRRLTIALDMGMRVSLEEAHEKLGVREVTDGEAYIQKITRPATSFGQLPTSAPEIIYPVGESPPPGELPPPPDTGFNLPPGGGGQPPPANPPGGGLPGEPAPPALPAGGAAELGPDVDEPDSVQALCDQMNEHQIRACEHGRVNLCEWCGIERERNVEIGADGEPKWIIKWRPLKQAAAPLHPMLRASETDALWAEAHATNTHWLEIDLAHRYALAQHGEHVCLATQPESVYGSPDVMVERGVDSLSTVTGAFADAIVKAVSGKSSAAAIRNAIDATAKRFGIRKFEEPVERELLHGSMLGALDSDWEAETGKQIEVESFAALHEASVLLAVDTKFAARPLADAIRAFLDREVVTREVFDEMRESAKRRAFTVAGAANEEMVRTVKQELLRQLATGADLADFGKHAAKRFESAGWTPANTSHVDTIFRTNVIGGYSGGRARQMTQPEVLEARPFWQILGVQDGRQRQYHAAAHGKVLRADDPFWQTAYSPFGFSCRCRVRSLSLAQVGRAARGPGTVVEGSSLKGLPDPGFASGLGRVLG